MSYSILVPVFLIVAFAYLLLITAVGLSDETFEYDPERGVFYFYRKRDGSEE